MIRLFSVIRLGDTWVHVLVYTITSTSNPPSNPLSNSSTIYFTRKREWGALQTKTLEIGRTYGSVTILAPPTLGEWPVKCYCGRELKLSTGMLLSIITDKKRSTCECPINYFKPAKDKTLGAWTIKSDAIKEKNSYFYLCQCSCGSAPQWIDQVNLMYRRTMGCRKCRFKRKHENSSDSR